MLQVFGFDRVAVAMSDLYFLDPHPGPGQDGPERGVRLEVRLLAGPPADGSIYASRPILVDRPIWRADLLESVAGGPGTWDRTHHHPRMRGWEPDRRQFDDAMTADPLGFVASRLRDLDGLLDNAGVEHDQVGEHDAEQLRACVPGILAALRSLLDGVREGRLAQPSGDAATADLVRTGWL